MREQDRLIQQLLDGEIKSSDFEALQEILLRDPAARRRFYDYARIWQGLHHRGAGQKKLETGFGGSIRANQHRRSLRLTLVLAAAAVLLIAAALRLIPAPDPPPTVALRASQGSLFTVTHSPAIDGDKPLPGTMEVGSVLELAQGTVELELKGGVTAVVRAPSRLVVHRDDRLYLQHGTAWFRVGESGHGFSVVTPEIEVVDLGTEFGVISGKGAHDEAHCLEGEVLVRGLGPSAQEETLKSGKALKVDPTGKLKPTPLRQADFLTSLPPGLAHLHWSFDGDGNEGISPGGNHPVIGHLELKPFPDDLAQKNRVGHGRFGSALRFDGHPDYILTDWPGVLGDGPRSVAMWIKLPAAQRLLPMHLLAWGSGRNEKHRGDANRAFFVGLSKAGASFLEKPGAGGPRSVPVVSFGASRYFCLTADVHDGKWHHLAWTYNGGNLSKGALPIAFYFDGEAQQLVAEALPANETPEMVDSVNTWPQTPLVIGARLAESKHPEVARESCFTGELDELYIIEGAITPETVELLFRRNQLD